MPKIGLLWGGRDPCNSAQLFLFALDPVPGQPSPYCIRQLENRSNGPTAQISLLSAGYQKSRGHSSEGQKSKIELLPTELLDQMFTYLGAFVIREERHDGLPPQLGKIKSQIYPLLFVSKRFHGVARRHLFRFFRNTHHHEKLNYFTLWLRWDPKLASRVRKIEIADYVHCDWAPGGTMIQSVRGEPKRQHRPKPWLGHGVKREYGDPTWHEMELAALLLETPNLCTLTLHIGSDSQSYRTFLGLIPMLGQPSSFILGKTPYDRGFLAQLQNLELKHVGEKLTPCIHLHSISLASLRRLELDNVKVDGLEDDWTPRSTNIESIILKSCFQFYDIVVPMIHACKALRHFSYVVSPPAPSVQPHQAPIIIVPGPKDLAPHHDTLETLIIDNYGRPVQPGPASLFAPSILAYRSVLTRFTALKHVDVPSAWFQAMLVVAIQSQGGVIGMSKNMFPSSLQTLSINGMTIGDRNSLNIIIDISQCVDPFFPHLRVVKIVGNWGGCRGQEGLLIHVAQLVVNAGLEMHIGWSDDVVRRTWIARTTRGEGQGEGAERRIKVEVEVNGRLVETELDWVDALRLVLWNSNTR